MARLTEEELLVFTERVLVIEDRPIFGGGVEVKVVAYLEAIPRQPGDPPLPGMIGTIPPVHPQLRSKPAEPKEVNDSDPKEESS
jgi:hypothetical protein